MLLGDLFKLVLSRTEGGKLFNMCVFLVMVMTIPLCAVVGFSYLAYREHALEQEYHQRYAGDWKVKFEEQQGSLDSARFRAHGSIAMCVVVTGLGLWVFFQFLPAFNRATSATVSSGRSGRRKRRRRKSS